MNKPIKPVKAWALYSQEKDTFAERLANSRERARSNESALVSVMLGEVTDFRPHPVIIIPLDQYQIARRTLKDAVDELSKERGFALSGQKWADDFLPLPKGGEDEAD